MVTGFPAFELYHDRSLLDAIECACGWEGTLGELISVGCGLDGRANFACPACQTPRVALDQPWLT